MKALHICALLTILALVYALRWRLLVEAVQFRLKRLDRLLEAGRRREAERTMAAVKRDCEAWFGPDRGYPETFGVVHTPHRTTRRCRKSPGNQGGGISPPEASCKSVFSSDGAPECRRAQVVGSSHRGLLGPFRCQNAGEKR